MAVLKNAYQVIERSSGLTDNIVAVDCQLTTLRIAVRPVACVGCAFDDRLDHPHAVHERVQSRHDHYAHQPDIDTTDRDTRKQAYAKEERRKNNLARYAKGNQHGRKYRANDNPDANHPDRQIVKHAASQSHRKVLGKSSSLPGVWLALPILRYDLKMSGVVCGTLVYDVMLRANHWQKSLSRNSKLLQPYDCT